MSDVKGIANNYLEDAAKLRNSSLKYIIGLAIIILFCWVFAEQVFHRAKFDAIRLNILEQKKDSLSKILSKNFDSTRFKSFFALKKKTEANDSVSAEIYKDVEENVPQALKILLKQATRKPFGILITSLATLFLLVYLFTLRRNYLRKVAMGLRILKEEEGYNKIYDYNISIPFWATPLPQTAKNGISHDDLVLIGGLKKKKISYYSFIGLVLASLLIVQGRLYYISLITNSYTKNWILIIQAIALILSIAIVLIWLFQFTFENSYKHETTSEPNSRRNFVTISSFLIAGSVLGLFSHSISKGIIKRILNPRFVVKKKRRKDPSCCSLIEMGALAAIAQNNLPRASDIIFAEITKESNRNNLKSYTRVFDLLIRLCHRNKNIFSSKYKKTITLANQSGDRNLVLKSIIWEKVNEKKRN